MALSRVTRFSDFLTRTFSLKGSSEPQNVIGDVMPVIGLVDPTDVEHHWTRNEILWALPSFQAAGGAGTYTTLEIGSVARHITVIEAVIVTSSLASSLQIGLATATLTGAANRTAIRCDSRSEVAAPPPAVRGYSYTPAAALAASFGYVYLPANTPVTIPLGSVIDADDRFHLSCTIANTNMWVTLYGYDRPAEDWERA